VAGVDARRATPPDPSPRWGLAGCCQLDPSHPTIVTCEVGREGRHAPRPNDVGGPPRFPGARKGVTLPLLVISGLATGPPAGADLWPHLFSDVNCIALWINSEKILTRLYSILHWFHKRLEVNVKNPWENRCFQTVIVCSFGSVDNAHKCTLLWKIAGRLITVSTSVNNEMWVKLSGRGGRRASIPLHALTTLRSALSLRIIHPLCST